MPVLRCVQASSEFSPKPWTATMLWASVSVIVVCNIDNKIESGFLLNASSSRVHVRPVRTEIVRIKYMKTQRHHSKCDDCLSGKVLVLLAVAWGRCMPSKDTSTST